MAPGRSRSLRSLAFGSMRRNTSPRPPSPTFSETTNVSAMNFGADGPTKIITRANLKTSVQAYDDLMTTCSTYRAALITMSKATAAFADAMERCSGLKGPTYEAGTRLQAASGVHHLIGNLWHVLSESLDKNFEKPLRQHLDSYKVKVAERSHAYERALREKSQIIRETEARSMNKKERNLQNFREALNVLQRQVDELDELKVSHYEEILEHEEEVWDVVQGKVCVVVRSTMDVFDRFTSKASDPVIEPMLQSVPDPFDSYGPPQAEDQIFSILTPLSILTSTPSSTTSPMAGTTPEPDPIDASKRITSWLPGTNGALYAPESTEWATIPSPSATPPRSVSPPSISPPGSPARRHSVPNMQRKAESKLRSVLSVIDEVRSRNESDHVIGPASDSSPPPSDVLNSALQYQDGGQELNESFRQSLQDNGEDGQLTPRHSTVFTSRSPPPPPDSPPNRHREPYEPDDQVHVAPVAI